MDEVLQQRKNNQLWMLLTSWSLKKNYNTCVWREASLEKGYRTWQSWWGDQQWSLTAQWTCWTSVQHPQGHLCLLASGVCLCVKWWPLGFGIVHPRALKSVITAWGKCPAGAHHDLGQCFSNVNAHMCHLSIFLKGWPFLNLIGLGWSLSVHF